MREQISIAQARVNLPALVHRAENGDPVEITRHGKPVAVLVSVTHYRKMNGKRSEFFAAVLRLRRRFRLDEQPDDDPFANLRDRSPGRRVRL